MSSTPAKSRIRPRAAVTDDTPVKSKQIASAPALFGDVKAGREAVMSDVGDAVTQVPLDWFKQHILPPLPAELDSAKVLKKLRDDGIISGDVWRDFPKNPGDSKDVEDVVFASFEVIARSVGNVAQCCFSGSRRKPTVEFRCNPRRTPLSMNRHNKSKPDGYGLYKEHVNYRATCGSREIFWELIVAPGEVKKNSRIEDINDNIQKILWSLNHIMREDPSRRFVLGYTIENTSMRLWFSSRSNLLVTAPFDFLRDHASLVYFLLSQMYAKPAGLGYDTTMKPAIDSQLRIKNQWKITVHHVEPEEQVPARERKAMTKKPSVQTLNFVTTKVLSNIGAEGQQGRGTRVWLAQQIVDGHIQPTKYVIKDYWVDDDRLREATIRQRIIEDAPSQEQKEILQRHLLTPFCSGDVLIDNEVDNTCLLRRDAPIPTDLPSYPVVHKSVITIPDGELPEDKAHAPKGSGIDVPHAPAAPAVKLFHDKSHHRIVFIEQAETIDTLTSMGETIQRSAHALLALATIHQTGWVHGDISPGNLLVFDTVVKIADLEYAKKMSATSSHSERSGTALFMSIEVDYHAYRFRGFTRQRREKSAAVSRWSELYASYKKGVKPIPRNTDGTSNSRDRLDESYELPRFRYNPLHDIESLWWLLVYLTLYRSVTIADDTQERRDKQRAFYRPFFYDRDSRRDAFMEEGVFLSGLKYLHPALHPVARALENFRRDLVTRYSEVESGDIDAINHTVADEVAMISCADLLELAGDFFAEDLELIPVRWKHIVEEPAQPAATAVGGVSLDSQLLLAGKKRVLDDSTGAPERNAGNRLTGPEASGSGQSSKRTKHHSRAKADTERNIPARKSRSTSRKRAKSSQSREEMPATLRRSQRIRKSQSARR